MSEEILINVTPVETRVALVENGMLQEAYIERTSRKGIVGNIYKGKVVRVLNGRLSFMRPTSSVARHLATNRQTPPGPYRISVPCCGRGSPWWCR